MVTRPIQLVGRVVAVSVVIFLALVALLGGPPVQAGERGAFTAAYQIKNVVNLGNQVQLTFSLHLFNLSGERVTEAAVTLHDSHLRPKVYGKFPSVSLWPRESTQLSQQFTIPAHEYARWQKGARPNVIVEYRDSAGNQVRKEVSLIRRPVRGKE